MHSALHVSQTGLSAQDKQLNTISNNLSNVGTVGFKRDRAVFEDLLYQTERQPGGLANQNNELPSGLQLGTGVRVVSTQKEFTTGNLKVTDQPLDVAIDGRGFIQVLQPDGNVAYTRNGQLQINGEGELVTNSGHLVEPGIVVPENASQINISEDGIVSAHFEGDPDPQEIGQIQLADFINPSGLESVGGNLYVETVASGAPVVGAPGQEGMGSLKQGMLESSNVDIVQEMVDMISTQRAYEMNSKVVSSADQMLQYINQTL